MTLLTLATPTKPAHAAVALKIILSNPTPIQAAPEAAAALITTLPAGAVGVLYDMPQIPDTEGRNWKWFETPEMGGFILSTGLQFTTWEAKPEPPPPAPLPKTYAITIQVEGVWADRDYLDWVAQLAATVIRSEWNVAAVKKQIPAGEQSLAPLDVRLIISEGI